ncbi:MAG: DNA repair protein RadC [Burkholderiales bacterium]|nr:MAG: DNA repair protein RadC [Burkholderiales bacterium]
MTIAADNATIAAALAILDRRLGQKRGGHVLGSPQTVRDYLLLRLAELQHEIFGIIFVDAQNRVIEARDMFRGTLTQTVVYPREVVRAALDLGAHGVILYHNHPSGTREPSRADEMLTQNLKTALRMVDVNVLDHLIIAGTAHYSFAEHGQL